MSAYSFDVAPFAKLYIDSIVVEMIKLFGISRDEALGRINRHWKGVSFEDQQDIDGLTNELPDYWARRIYYGPNAKWWLDDQDIKPLSYP